MSIRRYADCATRLENRGDAPPTLGYVRRLVRALQSTGVEAVWHSGVDPKGVPLFPSKVLPDHHRAADAGAFRSLTAAVHAAGRPVLSWFPMNLGGGVLGSHPEWRMRFYSVPGTPPNREWARHYACFNSPYGQLLPRFAAELVTELGFDGVWFDGSTFSNHNTAPWFAPGCRCRWCARRFARDTGLALPVRIDYDDAAFKRWVCWRYDVLVETWKACVDAVAAVNPSAVVCFNNYRRRSVGTFAWNVGIPLRRINFDCMMSGELDGFPHQVDFQIKMHRAYGCARGVETWWPLCDHWNAWVPDVEPLAGTQASLGAIAAGGATCMGIGAEPALIAPTLTEIQKHAGPRIGYRTGDTVEYAAIWCSQQDQDFFGREDPQLAWDRWHGANELCRHSHVQSSVVFDDHVAEGDLGRFPVLIAGETRCVSRRQAAALEGYVRAGGVLLAVGEAGTLDKWGDRHRTPVLNRLLGVQSLRPGAGSPTLEIVRPGWKADGLTYVSGRGPFSTAAAVADCKVWARTVERTGGGWDGHGGDGKPGRRSPGLWVRRVGRGAVVWCGVDLMRSYLVAPTAQLRDLFGRLLRAVRPPAVEFRGPVCVTLNVRSDVAGAWFIHLHNAPGTVYAYPNPPGKNCTFAPGEVLPVYDLQLRVPGRQIRSAQGLVERHRVRVGPDGVVALAQLDRHEVVCLTFV